MKRIGLFTHEQFINAGENSIGSSRIRARWLLPYWPEAQLYQMGRKYAVMIFQKAYFMEYLKAYDGIKILDLCDPDWLEGKKVVEIGTPDMQNNSPTSPTSPNSANEEEDEWEMVTLEEEVSMDIEEISEDFEEIEL